MSDPINNVSAALYSDISLLDNARHDGIKSSGHSVNGNLIEQGKNNVRVQGEVPLGFITIKHALSNLNNNNVNDLNLIHATISKLKAEIIPTIPSG